MNDTSLATQIHDSAIAADFDNCGIIPIENMDKFELYLQARTKLVPQSRFFYQAIGDLADIKGRFPWAKSVVICTYWLGKYHYPASLQGKYAKSFFLSPGNAPCGKLDQSCGQLEALFKEQGLHYAGGRQLGALSIGPLRYAAMAAGLGIIRKNNFLYTEKGSFIELVGYVIDRPCTLRHNCKLRFCAVNCHLCQDNCPSGALKGPFTMNPFECVSYLTTFGKGELPPGMDEKQCGGWVCGCDRCQDICPFNRRHDWSKGDTYPGLETLAPDLQPEKLLTQSDEFLQERVIPYTDHHVAPDETKTLRRCAARSLRTT